MGRWRTSWRRYKYFLKILIGTFHWIDGREYRGEFKNGEFDIPFSTIEFKLFPDLGKLEIPFSKMECLIIIFNSDENYNAPSEEISSKCVAGSLK